jgi:hypothetical protein
VAIPREALHFNQHRNLGGDHGASVAIQRIANIAIPACPYGGRAMIGGRFKIPFRHVLPYLIECE